MFFCFLAIFLNNEFSFFFLKNDILRLFFVYLGIKNH